MPSRKEGREKIFAATALALPCGRRACSSSMTRCARCRAQTSARDIQTICSIYNTPELRRRSAPLASCGHSQPAAPRKIFKMIPQSIARPARAAQYSATLEEALQHQKEALAAAWHWGFEEFRKKRRRLWTSEAEALELERWTALAGNMPSCGPSSCTSDGCAPQGSSRFATNLRSLTADCFPRFPAPDSRTARRCPAGSP